MLMLGPISPAARSESTPLDERHRAPGDREGAGARAAAPHGSHGPAERAATGRAGQTGQIARVDAASLSDVGLRRRINEDRAAVVMPSPDLARGGVTLIVADGLGGHGDGDKASEEAVRFMSRYATRILPWVIHYFDTASPLIDYELRRVMRRLHRLIAVKATRCGFSRAMGTTLTACHIYGGTAHVIHAGDSRCYLLRDGELVQITSDHTYRRMLVDAGVIRPDDQVRSVYNNALCNCLGGGAADVFAELHHERVREGDTLLLCSDGLTKHVSDAEIARVLASGESAERCCERLVDAANAAGGTDNTTVAVCRLLGPAQARGDRDAAAPRLARGTLLGMTLAAKENTED